MTKLHPSPEKVEKATSSQNHEKGVNKAPPDYAVNLADLAVYAWKVRPYSQSTGAMCWEACGRMLYAWKHGSLNGYARKAGKYLQIAAGLTEAAMDGFYRQLGLRALPSPNEKNLQHALRWGPVIFTATDRVEGHALVATGYQNGIFEVMNPCAVETVDFETNSLTCQAGTVKLDAKTVGGKLGSLIWYW